ncbi:hypothetical protein [Paenibacillus polymyxa]|uniref:hypothetical protein n=1 Tax=Paenibacillus polymyxa TaxID=1406 RepID=UPI001E527C23|nr:hypothetical protein [Paenibacillus polymyxa]WPQ59038.1 hypothetical protein SKN87_11475 [Paenibacillus polymyxa]
MLKALKETKALREFKASKATKVLKEFKASKAIKALKASKAFCKLKVKVYLEDSKVIYNFWVLFLF